MSIWRDWLPAGFPEKAQASEPERFRTAVHAFSREWAANKGLSGAARSLEALKWISVFKSCMSTWHKPEIKAEDANMAVEMVLDVVLTSKYCTATRIRWGDVLRKLLRNLRKTLTVTVSWRDIYHAMCQCADAPAQAYTGLAMHYGEIRTWAQVVHRSRRFFAPEAAQEVWDEFSPALGNIFTPQCLEAMGWIVLFTPHHQLAQAPVHGDWNDRVAKVLQIWEAVSPCEWFNNQALGWLARLAKHDRQGTIDWQHHLAFLYTRMLWTFHVPVGTATAQLPFTRGSMVFTETMFSLDAYYPADSVGKLAVYLLNAGRPSSLPNGEAMDVDGASDDTALAQLERLGDLLEQYFHPSNNGSWDKSLASLLNTLTKHLGKRLAFERSPRDAEDRQQQASERVPLDEASLRRIVQLLVRVAGRAQYSKSHSLQSSACSALYFCAYIAPDLVLPLVYQRFQEALVAVAAVHQLVSAVHTFSHCLRPLLLSKTAVLSSSAGPGGLDIQVPVGEAIAGAMMATLPGIDANDPSKCLTIFRFYALALSSLPALPEHPGELGLLPLDTSIWLDDLLSRIFTMLENLEAPETRADTSSTVTAGGLSLPTSSFLIDKQSVFRPMLGLLFARLPGSLRDQAFKRIFRFIAGTCLPSIARDACALCEAAVRAAPAEATQRLLQPLLERLQPDLSSHTDPSKAEEASQQWRLIMIEAMTDQTGPNVIAVKTQLADVIRLALYSSSKAVQECGQTLLIALTNNLAFYYPLDGYAASSRQHKAAQSPGTDVPHPSGHGLKVESWGEFRYRDGTPAFEEPTFHQPSQEEVGFLEELVSEHLENAARALVAEGGADDSVKTASAADKQHLRGLLLAMSGCLGGLGTCLPAIDPAVPAEPGVPLSVIGQGGVAMGSAELRQQVQEALVSATGFISDPELLTLAVTTLNQCVSAGNLDYTEYQTSLGDFRDDAAICNEPLIAGLTHSEEGLRWVKRWPRWLVVDRVWVQVLWRGSQAAFRPWLATQYLDPPASAVPSTTWDAVSALAKLSLHSYPDVRSAASSALHLALKRTPCLAPAVMPVFLGALAGLELPAWDHSGQAGSPDAVLEQAFSQLVPLMGQMRQADAFQQLSAAEAAKEEGEVAGAANFLSAMTMFRLSSRQPLALAALAASLMASGARTGPKTAGSIAQLFSTMAVRLIRPPALTEAQFEHAQLPTAVQQLREQLRQGTKSGRLHWRYGIMAEALEMFLLPPEDEDAAAVATQHALDLLVTSVPGLRALGAAQILSLLQPSAAWRSDTLNAAIKSAVQDKLNAAPGYGQQLMTQLTHAHPAQHQDANNSSASMMQRLMAKPKEELVVDTLTQAQAHLHDWPANRPRPSPLANDTFKLQHARIIKALAEVAPAEVHATLRAPLEAAVLSGQQDDDRPRTYAAAEVLAGLLAAGQWSETDIGAWEWLKPVVVAALDAAPMDLHDVWATSMRFVLNGLAGIAGDMINILLPTITQHPPADAPSSAQVRRLKVLAGCLAELSNLGASGALVRRSADAVSSAVHQRQLLPEATAEAVAAAHALRVSFLREVQQLSVQTGKAIREVAAGCTVLAAAPMLWEAQAGDAGAPAESDHGQLARSVLDAVAAGMQEGLSTVTVATEATEPSTPAAIHGNGHLDAAEPGNLMGEPSIAKLGFALQLVLQTTRGGENVSVGPLVPTLAALLPSLLRVQELTAPEVQPLALEAKTAAAVVKYIPWPGRLLPQLTELLASAPTMQPWMARGAALAFAQYFWFRHAFLLNRTGADQIQGAALALLHDRKLEVQDMAAALLAGLLKGLTPTTFSQLRQQCIQQAETLFPAKRHRKKAAAAAGTHSIAEKHAAVLSLKAFVLSSPYDVPEWLASVLVTLLRAAGQPSPIDTTVRKTLAEFKRTHEEAALAQAQHLLGEEQWEAMRDVASPASYFA